VGFWSSRLNCDAEPHPAGLIKENYEAFEIYLNYDLSQAPIGFVELDTSRIPEDILSECALVTQTKVHEDRPKRSHVLWINRSSKCRYLETHRGVK
jgi:hypothetical protein